MTELEKIFSSRSCCVVLPSSSALLTPRSEALAEFAKIKRGFHHFNQGIAINHGVSPFIYSQLHRFYRQIIIIWQKCPIPQNFHDIFIAILSNAGFSVKCLPLYLTFHVFQEKRIVFMEQHPHNEQKYLTQRIVTRKTSPTKGRARGSTKNGIVKILQNSVMNAFGFYGCIGSEHFHVGPYALT